MLHQSILDKIRAKYGKETIYSRDCRPLAGEMDLSEATVKRMFGLVGVNSPERNRNPHISTMDIVAQWLGFASYKELLLEINEGDVASEFTEMNTIETQDLDEGTQIQLRYEPGRVIVMTYLGNDEFVINESKNCKLIKGDRVKLTHLVLGQEMLVKEVVRGDRNLGSYRGAKDGGLTTLEIIV